MKGAALAEILMRVLLAAAVFAVAGYMGCDATESFSDGLTQKVKGQ